MKLQQKKSSVTENKNPYLNLKNNEQWLSKMLPNQTRNINVLKVNKMNKTAENVHSGSG